MNQQDYISDLAQIRSMMERSSKFLSLSGRAGIMAGIYALTGVLIAHVYYGFDVSVLLSGWSSALFTDIAILAVIILVLTVATAIYFSSRNAAKRGEKLWNPISRLLVTYMLVPLITGGVLMLMMMAKNWWGIVPATSLIFYGLALFNASRFTYKEVQSLGLIQILLGLVSFSFPEYSVICWSIGFGAFHIFYGTYMYYTYER